MNTPQGTPYTVSNRDAYGAVTVTVGNHAAAKRVRRDASPKIPGGGPLRWRSLDGQVFDTLDQVADSMAWAIKG